MTTKQQAEITIPLDIPNITVVGMNVAEREVIITADCLDATFVRSGLPGLGETVPLPPPTSVPTIPYHLYLPLVYDKP